MGRLDPPMLVVTALADDGERAGCLVGFSTQCSIDPPRYIVCVSRRNRTFDVVSRADAVAVHFLGQGQRRLAELFGGETGDEVDKFGLCEWSPGPASLPILAGAAGWFAADVLDRIDVGDHLALWLAPTHAEDRGGLPDLGFQAVKAIEPGHEP